MLGVPLALYFFVLFSSLIVAGSASLGPVEIVAIGAMGFLCIVVVRSWSTLMGDHEKQSSSWVAGPRVPDRIADYLRNHAIRYRETSHARADTAQELAHALHVSGHKVAKPVLVRADSKVWMVVLPASEVIDFAALRGVLHASRVEMVREDELPAMFPDCELGAEPPFGGLYRLPTLVEQDLASAESISFHGGRHDRSIEVSYEDYERMEKPLVAHVGRLLN